MGTDLADAQRQSQHLQSERTSLQESLDSFRVKAALADKAGSDLDIANKQLEHAKKREMIQSREMATLKVFPVV